jgi:hypothetical protein
MTNYHHNAGYLNILRVLRHCYGFDQEHFTPVYLGTGLGYNHVFTGKTLLTTTVPLSELLQADKHSMACSAKVRQLWHSSVALQEANFRCQRALAYCYAGWLSTALAMSECYGAREDAKKAHEELDEVAASRIACAVENRCILCSHFIVH